MARKTRWLVVIDNSVWSVVRLRGSHVETVEQQPLEPHQLSDFIEAVPAVLKEQHARHQPVLLAMGGMHCAAATVSIPSPRHARNRQAMIYLMEPYLPWPAENVVTDYETSGTQALMVAIERSPWEELTAAWQEAGINLQAIVPLARLGLQNDLPLLPSRSERCVYLDGSPASVDIWQMHGRQPLSWQHHSALDASLVQSVKIMLLTEPLPLKLVCRNLSNDVLSELRSIDELELSVLPPSEPEALIQRAAQPASQILDGRRHAPVDLCRESLALRDRTGSNRKSAALLQLSVIVLLISIGAAFLMKSQQVEEARQLVIEEQKQVFQRIFPDRRVPEGVRMRLESERLRLQGLRGESEEMDEAVPALAMLHRLLQSIPGDLRYRLLEVRIEDGQLSLIGEVRDHSDADTIASALRKAGLKVSSPQTHRLPEKGVGFRIAAEWPEGSGQEAAA
ncbi:MAG: hypothetical protein KDA93_22260 [Planctomycetaceae bacterium]|nr:hypothetical protein [Planctomycetaceae bacterium]